MYDHVTAVGTDLNHFRAILLFFWFLPPFYLQYIQCIYNYVYKFIIHDPYMKKRPKMQWEKHWESYSLQYFLTNECNFYDFCNIAFVRELIRKKALMVMHRFHLLSPTSVTHLYKDFRRCLSDSDPGVMDTCLVLLHDLIKVCGDYYTNIPYSWLFSRYLNSANASFSVFSWFYFHEWPTWKAHVSQMLYNI